MKKSRFAPLSLEAGRRDRNLGSEISTGVCGRDGALGHGRSRADVEGKELMDANCWRGCFERDLC
jgi:hypothetical protein